MIYLDNNKGIYHETYWINRHTAVPSTGLVFYAYFDSEYTPGYGGHAHREAKPYAMISLLVEGEYDYREKDGNTALRLPGLFSIHNLDFPAEGLMICRKRCVRKCFLIYKNEFFRKFNSCFFPEGNVRLQLDDLPSIEKYFDRIKAEFTKEETPDQTVLTGIYSELLEHVRKQQQEKKLPHTLSESLHYIESHLYERTLCREEIANAISISSCYLDRLFRKHLDKTVINYIMEKRLEEVARLLSFSFLRSKEIAAASGFASTIYMDRVFRKKFGMTPSQYRKLHYKE